MSMIPVMRGVRSVLDVSLTLAFALFGASLANAATLEISFKGALTLVDAYVTDPASPGYTPARNLNTHFAVGDPWALKVRFDPANNACADLPAPFNESTVYRVDGTSNIDLAIGSSSTYAGIAGLEVNSTYNCTPAGSYLRLFLTSPDIPIVWQSGAAGVNFDGNGFPGTIGPSLASFSALGSLGRIRGNVTEAGIREIRDESDVPEPVTATLLGLALAACGWRRRQPARAPKR